MDCHPQPGASQERCEARGCIWCTTDVPNAPWCFFPEDSPYGYSLGGNAEKTDKGWRLAGFENHVFLIIIMERLVGRLVGVFC